MPVCCRHCEMRSPKPRSTDDRPHHRSHHAADRNPTADDAGAYIYADTVSFTTLLNDLTAADPDPNDALVKLTTADLNIDSRTVVIHGVSDTTTLPATVATLPGLTPQQSLPVACGTVN